MMKFEVDAVKVKNQKEAKEIGWFAYYFEDEQKKDVKS